MRREGADSRLRSNIIIENWRRAMEDWNGLRFIGSEAKCKMLEKARREGAGWSGRVEVCRAVGRGDVRKGAMSEMNSELRWCQKLMGEGP